MKKVLFIDRDGTLIREPPDHQVDSLEKLEFYPGVFQYLSRISAELDYELVLVSNQDGMGTPAFPKDKFLQVHEFFLRSLRNEGIVFDAEFIDTSFSHAPSPNRKPGTGALLAYKTPDYDLKNSLVIGDRITDVLLARNLGTRAIWLNDGSGLGSQEFPVTREELKEVIVLETTEWKKIYEWLKLGSREAEHRRKTNETDILVRVCLEGKGHSDIATGLGFFDHMLQQVARHGNLDLDIKVNGDLHVDEHHTIEDTGITLGEAISLALGDKRGIGRFGFCLPMDDCLAQVALDFGGRSWLVWDTRFQRERIGEMPTEMFFHFFKSFADGAKCNLNIRAEGENEHHKIEAIFKAFARALKMAVSRDVDHFELPSTKGVL
ncbi:MAG TPA: bifunctional histidinol-phosphatase/imidazoleglycerol-phosphate dehydratase HisB [Chitinophagaceae bacterium]|nr:bifunctional histidinol-phosphatase/imidazoleglycerol-phosphate dehydratase HisB [Chitinophagaceae bacterium]